MFRPETLRIHATGQNCRQGINRIPISLQNVIISAYQSTQLRVKRICHAQFPGHCWGKQQDCRFPAGPRLYLGGLYSKPQRHLSAGQTRLRQTSAQRWPSAGTTSATLSQHWINAGPVYGSRRPDCHKQSRAGSIFTPPSLNCSARREHSRAGCGVLGIRG